MKSKRRIGRLRHRVTIKRRSIEYDEVGQVIETYTDIKTVAAAIETFGGKNLAQQGVADASLIVTIRHLAGLTPYDLLACRGEILYIGAIIDPEPDHPGRWLEVYCSKEPFENVED
ncbi:phage head closure protein [Rosistilla oblonga]|uniref:Phage head-tail joining protein n=1 Tax=Rosistilla oblonga TaxID=2527990 RepID=A0A518ITU6_9BACT|nr:phage head closure protein [Rosistilla oblonga]QDV56512.1 Phage head-tail joining protein [Rosistilla oblonga]